MVCCMRISNPLTIFVGALHEAPAYLLKFCKPKRFGLAGAASRSPTVVDINPPPFKFRFIDIKILISNAFCVIIHSECKGCFEGGEWLRKEGIHVESLAIIESLDNCEIKFKE